MNQANQRGDITAENSKSIVIESSRDDDDQQEELKESDVQRDNYVKNSDKSKRSFMDLLNNSTVSIMPVFPTHISQSGSNQKLNKEDLGGDIYYDNEQIGRTSRKEQQDSNRVLDQDENPPNYETPKLKSIVIKQFFFRFKWVISIIAAIIISTGIGVGIWSHLSGSNEPQNPPALFSKTNKPYATDYVKKGNQTFRTIKATPLVVDPISNKNIILFPITKEMFFLAINNPLLTELPMSFEVNEVANYTGTVRSKTESDVLVVNEDTNELVMHFNISFYTLQITSDHYQIVSHYMLTGTGNDSLPQPTVQPPSQNASEQAMISDADRIFSGGSDQNVQVRQLEFENIQNASDEDKMAYLRQMIKISICNVTREGIINECDFQNGMSFSDKSLAVKFLKLYVPDLKKSLYQNNKGKLRFLQELALNVPENGEAQYSLSSPNAPAVVMQSSKSQSEDVLMASKSSSTSSHELDLDKGKVSDVKKDESLSMTPTKTKGTFQKNETTVNSMDQQANVFINFVSHEVLSNEEIEEKYSMLRSFDFDTIKDPQSFFNNRKPTPLPINRTEMDDGQGLEMILSQGRNLASNNLLFPAIEIMLGKMNLLFVTMVGGFGFACSSDDICSVGFYIDIDPIVRMNPISKSIQTAISQTVREFRYYKMVFQKNIDLFYDLSQQIKAIIEDFIFGNLDTFNNSFQTLLIPMINVEAAIANYTDQILSKTIQFQNSIDISKTLSEVIDQYTTRCLEGFLGQAKTQINFLTKRYAFQIDKFADEISQTEAAFNTSVIVLVQKQREQILGVYDQTLDQFDQSVSSFHTDMIQKFDFVSFQVQSVSESQDITDFGYSDIINSIQNIVKSLFTVLLQPIRGAFTELKNNFRVIIHLYHAQMRESLTEKFDGIIDQIKEQAGNAELQVNQIKLLDIQQYTSIAQNISFASVILDITENTDDLFSSLQGRILSDILGAGKIIKEIATCSDEKAFFNTTFTKLKKDIDALNGTLILTIGQKINDTIKNASSRFDFVQKDISSIPSNVISLFSQPVNLNLPIGKIDLNQEINDIKALIQKVDDLMHDFTDMAKLTVKIESRITDIQTRALNILQLPERIKSKFTDALSKIKAVGDSIQQSFKLPQNGFSLTSDNFDALKNSLITQIRKQVIDYGKLKLKDLAKVYGGSFLVTLSSILDRKIAAITPASGKKIMFEKQYDKETPLFISYIPLAIGSLYTEIYQSFNAGVKLFFEYVGGKLQIVVDPKAKFLFGLRMAWDLVIARTGLQMTGTIFDVTIPTTAGLQLLSLTPKSFINSALQISVLTLSFSLVYCYLWPRLYWQCWYIGRSRCIRVCYPYIKLQWSSWMVIQSYNVLIGTRYTKTLINSEQILKLM